MKVYSPSDIANILEVKPATLRKYSALLEKHGYNIDRNSQGHRYYRDKDIITLRDVVRGMNSGATLEQSIHNVVKLIDNSTVTNDTDSGVLANGSDIEELKDIMLKQNELIKEMANRLDHQEEYIKNILVERDRVLLHSIDELIENKKQLEAPAKKKGLFTRLFNK